MFKARNGEQGEPFTIKKTYSSVAEMNADFNNMQLGDYVMIASTVEVEDNAKLYTRGKGQWIFITDFSGATGVRGETGLTPNIQIGAVTQGSSFNVTRTGTNENPVLNFTLVKGDKGDRGIQGIQGLTGNGISSITKTGTSGLVDTYTITYTNGNTTTFTITNGEDGEVTETELDVLRQKVANQQKVIDQLPQVTGQGTEVTLENTIAAQFTKFDVEGNSVQDGTPSPDNEVPILSAGDNGSITEKIANRNWNTSTLESGGLTNGLPNTNYTTCRTKDFIDIKPNTNFAFSINGTLNRVVVSMYDKDKNFIATAGGNGYVAVNGLFTTYANAYYIKYRAYNDDKQLFLNGNIQLEEGSTATPYVPHEEQDYSIPVQQPMRSIGDVRDCFVKKDDGWYERHYIGEVVLNGSEYWKLLNSTNDYYEFITYNSLKPVAPSSYTFPMVSHFGNATNNRCVINGNQLLIRVPASMNITNATEFKNWLQENNVTVNYLLAEPLDLPCTETQIQQLENIPSTYKDFTIIQSQDETEAYLEVSGIYDLNNLINN